MKNKFTELNTTILGISKDSVLSHQKFITKQKLTIDLISDPNEEICNEFDVMKEKVMFGKKIRSIERSTFILNEKNEIIGQWRKVKVNNHAKEVLDFISKL